MANEMQAVATRKLVAGFTDGTPMAALVWKAWESFAGQVQPGYFEGIVSAGLGVVRSVQACHAVRFTGDATRLLDTDFEIDLALAFRRGDTQTIGAQLGLLCGALEGAREAGLQLRMAEPASRAVEPAPAPEPAPMVNIQFPEEMKMRIVELPIRETTSVITRDSSGNITKTTQIESDVGAA